MANDDLKGRVALVTGASRGIGFATAVALARRGAHVIATGRTVGGLEELDDAIKAAGGESATLVPFDLKDGNAIDRLGAAIFERWKRLDILVGNAAVLGTLGPLAHLEVKAWTELMDVNVTANWRLIRSLDPLLRASDAGRVAFVTSGASRNFRAYWGGYSITKAALDALALTYAAECANTPVRVNLFNPGPTRTEMRKQAMPGEDPLTLPTSDVVAEQLVALVLPSYNETGQWVAFKRAV